MAVVPDGVPIVSVKTLVANGAKGAVLFTSIRRSNGLLTKLMSCCHGGGLPEEEAVAAYPPNRLSASKPMIVPAPIRRQNFGLLFEELTDETLKRARAISLMFIIFLECMQCSDGEVASQASIRLAIKGGPTWKVQTTSRRMATYSASTALPGLPDEDRSLIFDLTSSDYCESGLSRSHNFLLVLSVRYVLLTAGSLLTAVRGCQ